MSSKVAAAAGSPPDARKAVSTAAAGGGGKRKAAQVTPTDAALHYRMNVNKNIVDELLLVCGVIGTSVEKDDDGHERLVPVTDCLNWLQDLQRAVRRDDDLYRPISLLLGKWKILQHKLLPLTVSCRYDTPMVLTVVKILVILTKPLSDNTNRAGRMVIDTRKKGVSERCVQLLCYHYRCIIVIVTRHFIALL
jgi:timeless